MSTHARAHVKKTFYGDVEGESTTELLLAYARDFWRTLRLRTARYVHVDRDGPCQ